MVETRRLRLLLALALVALARAGAAAAQTPPADTASRQVTPAESAAVEQRLTEAVARSPDSFDAHHQLALFYLRQDKLAAAVPHLEKARAIDPAHYENGYNLGVALLKLGKLAEARTEVAGLLKRQETAELFNLLGDIEERAGDHVAAATPYQRAAYLAPTEEHLFDWGNNLLPLRAFEEAAQVFTAAIRRFPESARLHVGLGISYYARGQYEQAVESLCQAADLAPEDPRPYEFLGEMYGVAPGLGGKVTERLARFAGAQPKNARAQFYYAMSLWKGQPPDAPAADLSRVEALLRQAVALDRRLAKGFLELGVLLSDQKRYQEAIPELRRAIQIEPDVAQAHYRLAQAYQRTGQPALAEKELEIFQQLSERAARKKG